MRAYGRRTILCLPLQCDGDREPRQCPRVHAQAVAKGVVWTDRREPSFSSSVRFDSNESISSMKMTALQCMTPSEWSQYQQTAGSRQQAACSFAAHARVASAQSARCRLERTQSESSSTWCRQRGGRAEGTELSPAGNLVRAMANKARTSFSPSPTHLEVSEDALRG